MYENAKSYPDSLQQLWQAIQGIAGSPDILNDSGGVDILDIEKDLQIPRKTLHDFFNVENFSFQLFIVHVEHWENPPVRQQRP